MRIQTSHCLVASALAVPILCHSGLAQQPPTGPPATASKTQPPEVSLPVTVIDKHGALVTNLTAKDFTLTVDGRPQTIKSLTTQSNLPFKLGLLADTSRGVSAALDAERKAAAKFVDLMLPAGPEAAVAAGASASKESSAGGHGNEAFLIHFDREVELLEDFTDSREKLHRELDEMGPTSRERSNRGPESSGDERGSSGDYGQRGGTQIYDAIYLASDELMKPTDGRKALVVFSDGADRGSKETLNDAVDAADRAGVQVFTVYIKAGEERQESGFPGRRGGTGYPGGGYPGSGGGWPGSGGGGRRGGEEQPQIDGKKIMLQIAQRTGGQFFEAKKKDSLDEIYGLIAGALRQQYLLTYTPDKVDSESEFHHIVLKANNGDLTVVTREGYYSPDEKSGFDSGR